jgi:23S rRNA pseudouridine2605 synthase
VRERLQKILSAAGIASRRASEKLILEGRVQVDGEVVSELGASADPEIQDVRVDGARIRSSRRRRYVALNKPRGYVTTRSDPSRRPTVMELLPHTLRSLYPVGRLDVATTGLLILTDDGALTQTLTHPRFGVEKSYLVTLAGAPDKKALTRAVRGVVVEGERLALDHVEVLSTRPERRDRDEDVKTRRTRLRVGLRGGKHREIRRLFGALGLPVVDLHRDRIGAFSVRGIPPGGYRELAREEVELLRRGARREGSRLRRASAGRRSP